MELDGSTPYRLARLAEAAYPPDVRDGKASGGSHVVDEHDIMEVGAELLGVFEDKAASVEVFCCRIGLVVNGRVESYLAIPYRGTRGYRDALRDADARMVRTPMGGMHTGFRDYYMTAREWVLEMIGTHSHGHRVIHVGHSLGGGAAVVGAVDTQAELMTFGCPVPGDEGLTSCIGRLPSVTRYYFVTDPVVWMPGAIANHALGAKYDIGPWKGGGKCLGIGRHPIASYVRALA